MIFYERERSHSAEYLYHQNDKNLNYPLHVHNSFEFICVTQGELQVTIDQHTYLLKAGQASLIFPNLAHSYATPCFSESDLWIFSVAYIGEFYERTKDKISANPVFAWSHPEVLDDLQSPDSSYYLLKSHFYRIADCYDRVADYRPLDRRACDFASKVIGYVAEHFTEEIRLSALSEEFGYDYHYLSSLIHEKLGVPFPTLIHEYRIHHAQDLLRRTDRSVTEISSECGYDSIRSFNRNFQAVTGMTPTQYRNQSS